MSGAGITQKEMWYWLSNIKGIGSKKINNLLDFYGSVETVYGAARTEKELIRIEGLNRKDIEALSKKVDGEQIRKQFEQLIRKQIQFYSIEDKEYPIKLRNLYDPPYGIYVIGQLPKEEQLTIGIVGARNCSNYGIEIARNFSKYLAEANVQIVSGLARGVDGCAHEGALAANGYTLAILGSGIDYCYPAENISLYMEMERRGGIVSENGLGVKPIAGNFPRRNRLISAMCDGILVVEAKEKSGSLITVDQALEQGKDVFAIPGRIGDVLSAGTNRLIQMGAELVTHPEQILTYYESKYPVLRRSGKEEIKRIEEETLSALSCLEKQIFDELCFDWIHMNELLFKTNLSVGMLMNGLLSLQNKGYISQPVKNYFAKCITVKQF